MLQKDYILRVAEDVGRTLAQVIYHKEIQDYQGALSLIDELCKQTVGMGSGFIRALSEEALLARLTLLGILDIEKALIIAKLLKAEGDIYEDQGTVHTLATTFQESCVNVAKGSSLQVIPTVPSFHNLVNGSWVNGNQVPMKEPGAPTVNNVQVTSSTISIGPFTTAGTYHIYCTVHPNMNLTVIVN